MGEPSAELGGQPQCQRLSDLFPISRPVLAALFLLDDAPADLEVGVDLHQVHTSRHGSARPGDQFPDAGKEFGCRVHNSRRLSCKIRRRWPLIRV
jgi:hypothetical protein